MIQSHLAREEMSLSPFADLRSEVLKGLGGIKLDYIFIVDFSLANAGSKSAFLS